MKALVFNDTEWRKTGDLKDGNSTYWQEAEIINERKGENGEDLIDVRFIDSGLISNGHFKRGIRLIHR